MLINEFFQNFPMEWDPIEFKPLSERDEILNEPLDCIRAICLPPLDPNSANRWTFFLSTSEVNMTAIRLNCGPSFSQDSTILDDGSKAIISFERRATLVPPERELILTLSVHPGYTVGDIYDMIVVNNRHKFEIDNFAEDSRIWIHDQLQLFDIYGVFSDEDEIELAMESVNSRWPGDIPDPVEEGVYYG
ncbi:hypothetical protein DTO002I6_4614 [Penicillium roqueforti]|nr:hypothetical protein DTO002I6_4614 [Penicillium roqueforti]